MSQPGQKIAEIFRGVSIAHQTDPRESAFFAPNGDSPGKAFRRHFPSKKNFNIAEAGGGQLRLRTIEMHRRKPDSQITMQRICGACCQNAGPCLAPASIREMHHGMSFVDFHVHRFNAEADPGAVGAGSLRQRPIKHAAVHNHRLRLVRLIIYDLSLG